MLVDGRGSVTALEAGLVISILADIRQAGSLKSGAGVAVRGRASSITCFCSVSNICVAASEGIAICGLPIFISMYVVPRTVSFDGFLGSSSILCVVPRTLCLCITWPCFIPSCQTRSTGDAHWATSCDRDEGLEDYGKQRYARVQEGETVRA